MFQRQNVIEIYITLTHRALRRRRHHRLRRQPCLRLRLPHHQHNSVVTMVNRNENIDCRAKNLPDHV